jgi:dTDP-4-amino-4,6-dideoxygalactose transaminase
MTEYIHDSVALNDLQAQNDALSEELTEAVADAASSAQFIGGRVVEAFAEEFAEFCGVKHVIPCSNGTDALRLAIVGVLGEGDGESEIITVSHTFPSTLEAIIAVRYKPVLVDVDTETCLIDLECVETALTKRTVAVVPVHSYGQMVDVVRLRKWADARGVAVIEDAAQAIGAAFDGLAPGQLSEAAAFSFHPTSNLGAWGEAGAVVCRDNGVANRISQYADHGRSDKFTHVRIGCSAAMDAIQAAVLRVKLRHVDDWNRARQRAAGWYSELLERASRRRLDRSEFADDDSNVASDSSFPSSRRRKQGPALITPQTTPGAYHVFNRYVIQTPDRDGVRAALRAAGVASGIHYPIPSHEQPAYRHLGIRPDDLPVTHRLCRRILSLPMFPQLTRAQAESVVKAGWPAAVVTCS